MVRRGHCDGINGFDCKQLAYILDAFRHLATLQVGHLPGNSRKIFGVHIAQVGHLTALELGETRKQCPSAAPDAHHRDVQAVGGRGFPGGIRPGKGAGGKCGCDGLTAMDGHGDGSLAG